MQLTEEQIHALAPDDASKKAGSGLASSSKWISTGISPQALWGECQGSGSKPYQTQVDLTDIAFKCSCPSRKFPCKHGLGLMLLHARQPGIFVQQDMPAWVNDWISKRSEKAEKVEKKAEQADKPVDEGAQQKRKLAREQKVKDGIADLLVWLKDIVRNGILSMPEKNTLYWDGMARRMVDAQAGGLAAMVRELGNTDFWQEGWQSSFMDKLTHLYTIANAYHRSDEINDNLKQDINSAIGFTVNQDELKQQAGLTDTWLVIGKEVTDEQQLSVERNWLYGIKSGKCALVLQFIARGQFAQLALSPGMFLNAELVFFPSAIPYRAVIKTHQVLSNIGYHIKPILSWQDVAELEAELNSRLPFRADMPILVADLKPVLYQQHWWLQDARGDLCRLPSTFIDIWPLMTLSGGEPLTMAVIGSEGKYRPLGVWYQQTYKSI